MTVKPSSTQTTVIWSSELLHLKCGINTLINIKRFPQKASEIPENFKHNFNSQMGDTKEKKYAKSIKNTGETCPYILQESTNLPIYLFALPDPSRQEGQQVIYLLLD